MNKHRFLWASLLAIATTMGCSSGSSSSKSSSAGAIGSGSTSAQTTSSSTTPGTTPGSGLTGTPGEFTRTYQGRSYVLYVPDGYRSSTPLPLAVCFHGSGDSAANFWATMRAAGWDAAARSEQVILVVPDTKSPLRSFPVWSGNPNNDVPQMQAEMGEVIDLVQQDVATRYALQPGGVHGLGFSDGGLFLAAVGLSHPELATCSIFGYGWGAFYVTTPAVKRPVHMACGDADNFYPNAQAAQAFLRGEGHEVLWEPVAGVGHSFTGISAAVGPAASLAWLKARPSQGATTPPTTPPAGGADPSNGAGGQPGLQSRTVTTQAQGAVPSMTVTYRLYAPSTYTPATPLPIVFAGNVGLNPWQALAEQEGFIVVDFRDHDQNGGFRFDTDVILFDAIFQDVEAAYNVDRSRRYYHGFSAGAHWGYAVILANANLFAGLGISAGSMGIAIQQGIWPGQVQRKLPVVIRHGTTDAVVPIAAGRQDRDRLLNANHPVMLSEFSGGHTVSAQDAAVIWNFLKNHQRP